jgi:large subunit ribosomal protein L6
MSRIGKLTIKIPDKVKVNAQPGLVAVEGPKGKVSQKLDREMRVTIDKGEVRVDRPDDSRRSRQLHGLTRTLVANMVDGVTKGYLKILEIQGVGYKAEPKPFGVQLVVGFSHPVPYHAPAGVKISVENNVIVKIEGIDKEMVGQVAAELRNVRPPEPYKGKGIRYRGEQVRRKAGKTAQAASK